MAARYLVRFWGFDDSKCDHPHPGIHAWAKENWDFLEWRRSETVVRSMSEFIRVYCPDDFCCTEACAYLIPVEVLAIEPDDQDYVPFVQEHVLLLNGTFDWNSFTENVRGPAEKQQATT